MCQEITCPNCDATELNPKTNLLWIRANKVHDGISWNSHCMRCHVWFNESGKVTEECPGNCYCHNIYDLEGNDIEK